MSDIAPILQQLVRTYGPDIYRERRRFVALLRDYLPRQSQQWTYNLLILSVQQGILDKLIAQAGSMPVELLAQNHSRLFSESFQINLAAAQWVIDIWIHCFNLSKKKKQTPKPVSAPKPPMPVQSKPKPVVKAVSPKEAQITNDLGMVFVRIEPGTFMMGSPMQEKERDNSEVQHEVIISRTFYLQTTPVTQSQWQQVTGKNPAAFKDPQHPVTNISWSESQTFIEALNHMDLFDYRLPTEAEWEYAARAGSTTAYFFGDKAVELGDYAWYAANSQQSTQPVQAKKPNPWGLYDMYGNVREWGADWYGSYLAEQQMDPAGPQQGSYKVCRGGSWKLGPAQCRSASRHLMRPAVGQADLGLRLVLVV